MKWPIGWSSAALGAAPFTKCSFNNGLRQAGSAFDASPALLRIGFAVPAVREGVASL
jgi:hypothetical protein